MRQFPAAISCSCVCTRWKRTTTDTKLLFGCTKRYNFRIVSQARILSSFHTCKLFIYYQEFIEIKTPLFILVGLAKAQKHWDFAFISNPEWCLLLQEDFRRVSWFTIILSHRYSDYSYLSTNRWWRCMNTSVEIITLRKEWRSGRSKSLVKLCPFKSPFIYCYIFVWM